MRSPLLNITTIPTCFEDVIQEGILQQQFINPPKINVHINLRVKNPSIY